MSNPGLIEKEPGADWRGLQQRVALILQECGLEAETGRSLQLARGTVEIDVYATDPTTTPPAMYLCECKRWSSRVPQSAVQAFRTIVSDAGAHFGLFISAKGFQAGAHEVVKHTNINLLDWPQFQALFLKRWCTTYWVPMLRTRGDRLAGYVDPVSSDAAIREANGEPLEPVEAVGLFVHSMWGPPFNDMDAGMFGRRSEPVTQAIWNLHKKYRPYLPKPAAEAKFLRELLDALLGFTADWCQGAGRSGS
jgi:Restriction endonuclease